MPIESMKNEGEEGSAVTKAVKMIFEKIAINPEKDPRLAKAMVCYLPKEIAKAIQALQENPALPVLVIMIGKIERELSRNHELGVLLQYPNVRVADGLTFFPSALDAFKKSKKESLGDLNPKEAMEQALGIIRHNLRHALEGDKHYNKQTLLEEARAKLGFDGDEKALIQKIMEPTKAAEVAEFRNVPGVFIDWDGTLQKDSGLDRALLDRAHELAKAKGLPLVVWTGGDPDEALRKLAKEGVTDLNVCSKQDCQGFRVAMAIDDEPLESLKKTYGIDAKKFEKT